MAVTTLDPKTALVVIDLQKGILSYPTKPQPQDHTVTKRTPGAFTNTDLEAHLKKLQITQVVIAGVATSNGVEATARHAYELGFNVTLASDCMTDLSTDVHVNSITRIFPKLGEVGTAQDIIDLLARRD